MLLLQRFCMALLVVLSSACNSTETETNNEIESNTTTSANQPSVSLLDTGRQPQVAVDTKGIARVVYGHNDSIFCATSTNNGKTLSNPVLIASLKGLYLGMSMGPQIASSAKYSVVTAIDKKGNIHSYSLQHGSGKWVEAAGVNDIPGSVPEGLMSIDADDQDNFYAVWLDVRDGKQNKIVFASTSDAASTWTDNKIIYQSPDKTVCECCKPGIQVKGKQVMLMFRNWLNGSRDFYLTSSSNSGQEFDTPQKLGHGTWKLEGCPMDGGGMMIDSANNVHTVWQREGKIFYAKPGAEEVKIGEGRNGRISGITAPVITWNEGTNLKLKTLDSNNIKDIGKGSYLESVELKDKSKLFVWEDDKKVYFTKF